MCRHTRKRLDTQDWFLPALSVLAMRVLAILPSVSFALVSHRQKRTVFPVKVAIDGRGVHRVGTITEIIAEK